MPISKMAGAGAAISTIIPDRWAFEALGQDLGVRRILADGGSPLGPALLEAYADAGTQPIGVYWLYLAAFAGFVPNRALMKLDVQPLQPTGSARRRLEGSLSSARR